jgi:predicted metalloprotease with PDZ domain
LLLVHAALFALATPVFPLALGNPDVAKRSPAPVVAYILKIDPADSGFFDVTMRIRNAPPTLRLAMAVHPEYNQRYWRFVRELTATSGGRPTTITRDKDNVWTVTTRGGEATVHYRIALEPDNPISRPAWHSHLTRTGASVNSTDTFMYPLDYPNEPARITLDIPAEWRVITTLAERGSPRELGSRDFYDLVDSPLLLGNIRLWSFTVQGVPHRVAYWPLPGAVPFDTAEFVGAVERFARSTFELFGGAPYSSYTFMFQDGAWGGLEHVNSTQLGAQSSDLARNPRHYMGEIAHEFFHTWNLMALDPLGPNKVTAEPPTPLKELWFSEGVTMYFAEVLMRRSGATVDAQSRSDELAGEIGAYFGYAGNTLVAPERGSWASIYGPDSAEYMSNYYTQGRLIAEVLDIIVRDSTNGRRGMRDVMQAMYGRYATKRGFVGADVERVANEVCGCNVHQFFEDHVRNARPIDFNRYLGSLGLAVLIDTIPNTDTTGARYPDLRISAYQPQSGRMRVRILDPRTVWRTAGLRTRMELVAMKGIPIDSFPDFRRTIRSVRLGDVVPVDVIADGSPRRILVTVTSFDRTRVRIVERPDATPAQLGRRRAWEKG